MDNNLSTKCVYWHFKAMLKPGKIILEERNKKNNVKPKQDGKLDIPLE